MKRAVIIGKDVSKGARSPILWNAAFNALDIDAEMTTVDIEHESDAIEFLDSETTKPDFIGGAVAAPLKEVVANYFADDNGSFIEPKNCFFNSEGKFTAANTDTLALLESISSVKKDLDPLLLTTSCSGHVDSGESYAGAAVRECREELGLTISSQDLTEILRCSPCRETGMEFVRVYLIKRIFKKITPSSDEIDQIVYFEYDELIHKSETESAKFSGSFLHILHLVKGKLSNHSSDS